MPFRNDEYANLPSGKELLEKLAKDAYTPDFIEKKGPFLAKVLRVEQITNDSDDLTWIEELNNNFKNEEEGKGPSPFDSMLRLKVTARIDNKILEGQPNIHAHIPDPTQVGNETEGDAYNNQLISEHDEFISMSEGVAVMIPTPGDYVWVDYLDKQNFSRPIYMGPLKGNVGMALVPPCGIPGAPMNAFNQNQATGNSLTKPVINNPALLKGAYLGAAPAGKKYRLHGYVAKDFTQQKKFLEDDYYRQSLERLVAGIEVFHWYLEQIFPGKSVKIIDPKAATDKGHAEKSAHKNGSATDLDAKIDGKKLDNTTLSAIIFKLIVSGKIPDGGVGVYQTNWSGGPNKGKNDTFTNRNSLPLSDVPHWDYGISTNSPFYVDGKTVNEKGYKVRKWIKHTLNGNKKDLFRDIEAKDWLSKNGGRLPKYLLQRYNELPAPDANMPTWEQVIALRTSLAAGDKSLDNVDIKNPKPSNENTPKPDKPEENKTEEEKSDDEKKTKEDKKETSKASDSAQKNQETEEKKTTEAKKAQSIPQKTTPSTTAAFSPCTPAQLAAAQAGLGGILPPPATGIINEGTTIELPSTKKPTGLYSNPNVTTNVYEKEKDKNSLKNVKMFIIHESGGHGTSYWVASTRAKKIKTNTQYVYTDSQTGQKSVRTWSNRKQVHFWGGRAGDIAMTTPLDSPCSHANWCNYISIGYEVINIAGRSKKSANSAYFEKNETGYRVLGPDGNVGGVLTNQMLDGTVVKGSGVLKHGLGFMKGTRNYVLPGEIQCRRIWETIVWCSDANPNRLNKDVMNIPILFPATANDKKLSTGFKSNIGGGASVFFWGLFNPGVQGFVGSGYQAAWEKDLSMGASFKPKHHWQQGIVSHHRWPSHTDGCFVEYYCLGRAKGMDSINAYLAAIGAAAAGNPANNKKLNAGKHNVTYFPDQKYVDYGKKIWGSAVDKASLNWAQKNTSLLDAGAKYGKASNPKVGSKGAFDKVIG